MFFCNKTINNSYQISLPDLQSEAADEPSVDVVPSAHLVGVPLPVGQ